VTAGLRHLLSVRDLDRDTAVGILDLAEDMADVATRAVPKLPTLRGRTVANLFFEDSTRTRLSFEAAAKRLSADVITFSAKGSSVSKGESLKDTAQTIAAMGVDAVVLRHGASGAARVLADSGWIDAAIVNAGDGTHEHPTQGLLDAYTMRKRLHGDGSRGRARGDRRRHPALSGGAIERVAAADPWGRRASGGAADPPAGGGGLLARHDVERPRRRHRGRARRAHDAPHPERADARGVLPARAGVRAAVGAAR
jgi:aspartate carbamoyltransferase catalytic subunit